MRFKKKLKMRNCFAVRKLSFQIAQGLQTGGSLGVTFQMFLFVFLCGFYLPVQFARAHGRTSILFSFKPSLFYYPYLSSPFSRRSLVGVLTFLLVVATTADLALKRDSGVRSEGRLVQNQYSIYFIKVVYAQCTAVYAADLHWHAYPLTSTYLLV